MSTVVTEGARSVCLSTREAHRGHPGPQPGHPCSCLGGAHCTHYEAHVKRAALNKVLTLIFSCAHGRSRYSFGRGWAKVAAGYLLQLWSNMIRKRPDRTGSSQSPVQKGTQRLFLVCCPPGVLTHGPNFCCWKGCLYQIILCPGRQSSPICPGNLAPPIRVTGPKDWKDLLFPLSILWGSM